MQVFSVRLRDRGPDYRGFVQLPLVQDQDGNPASVVDASVLAQVGKVKTFHSFYCHLAWIKTTVTPHCHCVQNFQFSWSLSQWTEAEMMQSQSQFIEKAFLLLMHWEMHLYIIIWTMAEDFTFQSFCAWHFKTLCSASALWIKPSVFMKWVAFIFFVFWMSISTHRLSSERFSFLCMEL